MAKIINTFGDHSCGYNAFAMCFAINVLEGNVDKIFDNPDDRDKSSIPYYQELFRCIKAFHPNFVFKEGNLLADVGGNINQLKHWLHAYGETAADIQGLLAPPLRLFQESMREARKNGTKTTPTGSDDYEKYRKNKLNDIKRVKGKVDWMMTEVLRTNDILQAIEPETEDSVNHGYHNEQLNYGGNTGVAYYNNLDYKKFNDVFACLQFEPLRYSGDDANDHACVVYDNQNQKMLRFCFKNDSFGHYEWACPQKLYDKYVEKLDASYEGDCVFKKHSSERNRYNFERFPFPPLENAHTAVKKDIRPFYLPPTSKSSFLSSIANGIKDFVLGIPDFLSSIANRIVKFVLGAFAIVGSLFERVFSGISNIFGAGSNAKSSRASVPECRPTPLNSGGVNIKGIPVTDNRCGGGDLSVNGERSGANNIQFAAGGG